MEEVPGLSEGSLTRPCLRLCQLLRSLTSPGTGRLPADLLRVWRGHRAPGSGKVDTKVSCDVALGSSGGMRGSDMG